jgi:hypothetical protein
MRPNIKSVKEAWFSRDAHSYVNACVAEGLPIVDSYLLERYEADRGVREGRFKLNGLDVVASVVAPVLEALLPSTVESSYAPLVRIALIRFPPDISDSGLRRRAREINNAGKPVGYHLKPYSRMNRRELWDYLVMDVRREVAELGAKNCPSVLREVRVRNDQLKDEEKYVR